MRVQSEGKTTLPPVLLYPNPCLAKTKSAAHKQGMTAFKQAKKREKSKAKAPIAVHRPLLETQQMDHQNNVINNVHQAVAMPIHTGAIGTGDVVIICLLVAQLAVMVMSFYLAYTTAA